MANPKRGVPATEGAARTNYGPTIGWADVTVSSTPGYLDISSWAGGYVNFQCEDDDCYITFHNTAAVVTFDSDAAALGTLYVVYRIYQGQHNHVFVPKYQNNVTGLTYRSAGAGGAVKLRAFPS